MHSILFFNREHLNSVSKSELEIDCLLSDQFNLIQINKELKTDLNELSPHLLKSKRSIDMAKKVMAFTSATVSLPPRTSITSNLTVKHLSLYSVEELATLKYLYKFEETIKLSNLLFCSLCNTKFVSKLVFHQHLDESHFKTLHTLQKNYSVELQNLFKKF
jgi:hypothetical protein